MPDQPHDPSLDLDAKIVTLQRMPDDEADLARLKLEAEGIPCFTADANYARISPFGPVRTALLVREEDVQRALAVLATPPKDASPEDYVQEDWRCPQCRRKTLDLLPATPAQRFRRDAWFVFLVLGLLVLLTPLSQTFDLAPSTQTRVGTAWFLLLVGLGTWVVLGRRGKRCRECDWIKPA